MVGILKSVFDSPDPQTPPNEGSDARVGDGLEMADPPSDSADDGLVICDDRSDESGFAG